MIGYLKPKIDDLRVYEYKQYRSFYCGICCEIKKHIGELPRMLLSNDVTFFALLLSSLADTQTEETTHRCCLHAYKKKPIRLNTYTKYMADMNLLFAYGKIQDNLQDEGGFKTRTASAIYHSAYKKVSKQYPHETARFTKYTKELHDYETAGCTDYVLLGKLFGQALAELFQPICTVQTELISNLFDYLGQWIYCIDALDDLEKDEKEHAFNPMLSAYRQDNERFLQEVKQHINSVLLQIVYLYTDMQFVDYKGIVFNVLCIAIREKSDAIFARYTEHSPSLE
ncbi:DUF5685 family protein [Anaerosporobacter faecicola]|uniref:DUF5685 family protein n=1 Tax=Anaerosporobacter faecicola TaxID=2718714 RepID=UPI00143A5F1D|nr:DUF5685 family protein [Anaerosporobacter faecicola]